MRLVTEYMACNVIVETPIPNGRAIDVHRASSFSAGLDSAVLAAAEARVGRCSRSTSAPGWRGRRAELAALDRLLAAAPFAVMRAAGAARRSPSHDLYPATHWALRGEPPAFDTPDEDVYLTGRNVVLLSKAAIYCAQHGIGAHRHRPARRQSVSRCDAGVLRSDGARAVARPGAPRSRSTRRSPRWTRATVIRLGVDARRAARADAVVHEPAGGPALRPVQQVPRAPRRLRRRQASGSDDLRHAPVQ